MKELRPIGLAAVAVLLYLATPPGTVNADGLGYLKLLPHNFAAGHLVYMPLLRGATHLFGGDGLKAGRLVDALLGGSGVLLTYSIALRAAPLRADRVFVATATASGTAVSWGWWIECCDVEAYALAVVALLALVRVSLSYADRPGLPCAALMGVLLGASVLTHLTHVVASVFVVVVCLEDAQRRRGIVSAIVALAIGGTLSLAAYAYAAFIVRGHHSEGALRWVLSAQHGFAEHQGPYALAMAVYGLARTFVWSPYLEEAGAPRLIGQLLLGVALLATIALLGHARRSAVRRLPWRPLLALVLPYAVLAVVFFGADPERWIFVLPVLWLVFAVALDAGAHGPRYAGVAIALVFALNFALAIRPAHLDTWTRHRAELAATPLHDGDLVVFPGHAWDEYVWLYGTAKIEPFPVAYYTARDGEDRMWARLDREVGAATQKGAHVYAVRMFDDADDPAGWSELGAIGLPRATLRKKLRLRFTVVPVLDQEGVAVVRLDPLAAP